jgi:hypothetical protein
VRRKLERNENERRKKFNVKCRGYVGEREDGRKRIPLCSFFIDHQDVASHRRHSVS